MSNYLNKIGRCRGRWRGMCQRDFTLASRTGGPIAKNPPTDKRRYQAGLDAREGGGFVFDEVQDAVEANHLQQHEDALIGREKCALSAGAVERREGADEGADPGAIQVGNSREVDGDTRRSGIHELLNLIAEAFLGFAQFQRTIEIENRRGSGTADSDVQAASLSRVKLTEMGSPIKAGGRVP